MSIRSKSVKIGEREIKATWIREMAEDLSSFHSFDFEKEMEELLEEQLRQTTEYIAAKKREQREKKLKRIYGEK